MSIRAAPYLLISCLVAVTARAAIYENTVEVDDEDDLFDLVQRGDISEETGDVLLEIIREGVDLNKAGRDDLYDLPGLTYEDVDAIIAYREAKGHIDEPTELVGANAITAEQLIQIAPFIRIDAARPVLPVSGKLRAQSRFTVGDNIAPPGLLSAQLKGPYNLSAGMLMITTRRQAATPVYDPTTDALQSKGFPYTFNLPRAYAVWSPGKAKLVVGTFTIGFGERLTLDNTRRYTPKGIYLTNDFRRLRDLTRTCKLSLADGATDPTSGCDTTDGKALYVTPDYDWRENFRGVAGQLEDVHLGKEATMSMYGFLSYQSRSLYQYELYDRRYCDDPTQDNLTECKAPPVYLADGESKLVYSTLSYLFDEVTGGGHVDFKPSYQYTFGVTGFGALPIFHAQPMQLDFQEWSRYPSGGAFGAIGVNAAAHAGLFNFFIEATHSFDHRVGGPGGGNGVEQRTTFSPKKSEFELSLRYYDAGFGTPYARPISGPDELDGLRARNEAGARLRWLGRFGKDWEVRLRADFWVNPYALDNILPAGVPNLYGLARVNFNGWRVFQPAIWVDVRNRNLLSSEHGGCSSGTTVYTTGDPYVCSGDTYKVALRLDFSPLGKVLEGTLQGYFSWKDDVRYKDRFRNDVQLWAELRSQPVDFLQLRARTRYWYQDISDNTYLEQSSWSYFEAAFLLGRGTRIAARYDLYVWLDQRASTANRTPNPEHRFQLDVRVAF